ncbi:MAG: DUF3107 family protein [Acidimicrobiia bacterium]|nr:DUF3107 family protein [Acidimicrobiia bacterium]
MAGTENVTVRIGLQSVRELELEVADAQAVIDAVKSAMSSDDPVAWITDAKGTRHGIAVDKLGFIGVEGDESKTVGFG